MTKYVLVKSTPETLPKNCFVVKQPNFVEDIQELKYKPPVDKLMTANYLRSALEYISRKYDDSFTGTSPLSVNDYVGTPYSTSEDVAKMVYAMIKSKRPDLIDLAVEYQVKQAPFGTKLIYFTGSHRNIIAFDKLGIESIPEKDVDYYLGIRERKQKGTF